MGNVFAGIELGNPRKPNLASVRVRALADTGALMLCIPEHVAVQLDLARKPSPAAPIAAQPNAHGRASRSHPDSMKFVGGRPPRLRQRYRIAAETGPVVVMVSGGSVSPKPN